MEYNLEEIKKEAEYCLNCKNKPCVLGCPLQNDIPEFINSIKEENYNKAYEILSLTTIFEPICGRICPHKSQCEGKCTRGIKGNSVNIGKLEAFIGDYFLENIKLNEKNSKTNKKVAVIGSGPAGLACSYYLSQNGVDVTIYEKHEKLGGLLRYGIPNFRLDKEILDKWLNTYILNKNITIKANYEIKNKSELKKLEEEYDAIVLAFGANVSKKMHIIGEERNNVIGGNELLEYRNGPDFNGKNVAIIGGGNVAIDCARTIKKDGANSVTIIYRRSEKEMPAELKEIDSAKMEKINFLFQTNIIKVFENNIECIKTELIEKEGEKRAYPVDIEGSNFSIPMDYVILALGSEPNEELLKNINAEINDYGYINVNDEYRTSNSKVYAIGDLIGTKKTVAWAARSGFECAKKIIKNI